MARIFAVGVLTLALGCAGREEPDDEGGDSGGAGTGASDVGESGADETGVGGEGSGDPTGSDEGGSAGESGTGGTRDPVACGATVCDAGQYCVAPCCGGDGSPCMPPPPYCIDPADAACGSGYCICGGELQDGTIHCTCA